MGRHVGFPFSFYCFKQKRGGFIRQAWLMLRSKTQECVCLSVGGVHCGKTSYFTGTTCEREQNHFNNCGISSVANLIILLLISQGNKEHNKRRAYCFGEEPDIFKAPAQMKQ